MRKFEVLRLEHRYENVSRQQRYLRLKNEMCDFFIRDRWAIQIVLSHYGLDNHPDLKQITDTHLFCRCFHQGHYNCRTCLANNSQ
jgi:hypothetical protein